MSAFRPCQGKNACQDDGVLCRTCGRSAAEIETTRRLINELAETALAYGYDNALEFLEYVASKAEKKRRHALEQAEAAP
jgi:hypothetical protein